MEIPLGESPATRLQAIEATPHPTTGSSQRRELVPANGRGRGASTALGLLSIGLGVTGLVAPRLIAAVLGARRPVRTSWVLRALALRELALGIATLRDGTTPERRWARLPGDAIGLLLLGALRGNASRSALLATAGLGSIVVVDRVAAAKLLPAAGSDGHTRGVYATAAMTINVERGRVYRFWRELANLPRFMAHLESVRTDGPHPHFRARLPAGIELEWDAELTVDRPNERIQWRSLPGADLQNHGMVRFVPAPGGRGTEVHVMLSYEPPLGPVGSAVAKLFSDLPVQQLRADLRRLKQLLETGDLARSDASIHPGPHAARPADEAPQGNGQGNGSREVSR